nr:putative DSBA oxidoreductase [uncultured bacterium]
MTARLEFFFDYGSPWSYIANSRVGAVAERAQAILVYRPMLLGGVFKATGNRSPADNPVESKTRYGALDLRRWADRAGVPFQRNPHFPINTLPLMRLAVAAQASGVFQVFHDEIWPAFWADARNLGDPIEVRKVLDRASLDADGLLAGAQTPEVKETLKSTTEEAVARGAFGAPTFFVGDEMFFGNDRLDFVEEALERIRGNPRLPGRRG